MQPSVTGPGRPGVNRRPVPRQMASPFGAELKRSRVVVDSSAGGLWRSSANPSGTVQDLSVDRNGVVVWNTAPLQLDYS